MKLSITNHEADILKQTLKNNVMAEGILKKVEIAEETQEEKRNCDHSYGYYEGKKECCTKCGALGIGMGELWELKGYPIAVVEDKFSKLTTEAKHAFSKIIAGIDEPEDREILDKQGGEDNV